MTGLVLPLVLRSFKRCAPFKSLANEERFQRSNVPPLRFVQAVLAFVNAGQLFSQVTQR